MGLMSKYIEVGLSGNNIKYYENLGYDIPKEKDKCGRIRTKQGTKIKVKVEDLQKGSGIKVKVKCDNPNCGKEYEMEYKGYLKYKKENKIYCNACTKALFNSGENNGNYNNTKTQEEREIQRNYPKYTEFVKKVLSRDNYTCKCCGSKESNKMETHHLDGYNWCIEKRIDMSNVITLCENCHKNFHSIYGYGNNTKEQFEEWLSKALKELEKYNGKLPTTRKIYCIEEDKVYDSAEECAKYFNLKVISEIYNICNHTHGRNVCKNKHLIWYDEYIEMSEKDIRNYLLKYKDKNAPKKVYQYDKDYNLIKVWNSTNEPQRLGYNYSCSSISVHCRDGKIYKEYYWSYRAIEK